jgi:hypothetical protein
MAENKKETVAKPFEKNSSTDVPKASPIKRAQTFANWQRVKSIGSEVELSPEAENEFYKKLQKARQRVGDSTFTIPLNQAPKKDEPKVVLPKEATKKDEPKVALPKQELKKEEPKLDVPKQEPKKEEPKLEIPKEEPKKEEPKLEVLNEEPKKEEPKVEPPKEEPKKEEPKVESPSPKVESPKVVSPKVVSPKVEFPKVEFPKSAPVKVEPKKAEVKKPEPKKEELKKEEPKKEVKKETTPKSPVAEEAKKKVQYGVQFQGFQATAASIQTRNFGINKSTSSNSKSFQRTSTIADFRAESFQKKELNKRESFIGSSGTAFQGIVLGDPLAGLEAKRKLSLSIQSKKPTSTQVLSTTKEETELAKKFAEKQKAATSPTSTTTTTTNTTPVPAPFKRVP